MNSLAFACGLHGKHSTAACCYMLCTHTLCLCPYTPTPSCMWICLHSPICVDTRLLIRRRHPRFCRRTSANTCCASSSSSGRRSTRNFCGCPALWTPPPSAYARRCTKRSWRRLRRMSSCFKVATRSLSPVTEHGCEA